MTTPDLHRALADIKARLLEAKAAPRPDTAQIRALSAERIRVEGELSAASARHLTRHAERTIRRAAAALRDTHPDLADEVRNLLETP